MSLIKTAASAVAEINKIENTAPLVAVHDTVVMPLDTKMIVRCPVKWDDWYFSANISTDVAFGLESAWNDTAYGMVGDSQAFKMVDGLAQNFGGMSIQTPVWQRKVWGGTKPLDLNIDCSLVATGDAKSEVYTPVYRLCQALLPRRLGKAEADATGEGVDGQAIAKGLNEALSAFKGLFEFMAIPGPSPMDPNNAGDSVQILVGNVISMSTCYLKSVRGRFSKSLDMNGYPLACSLQISFSAVQNSIYTGIDTNAFHVMVENDALAGFRQFMAGLTNSIVGKTQELAKTISQ
jgi:hypothetical protein